MFVGPAMDELANVPYKDSFLTIGGSEYRSDGSDSFKTLQRFNNSDFTWTSSEVLSKEKGMVAAFAVNEEDFPKC